MGILAQFFVFKTNRPGPVASVTDKDWTLNQELVLLNQRLEVQI